jgi:hypothetical protein
VEAKVDPASTQSRMSVERHHRVLVIAQVLTDLLIKDGLRDRLRQRLEQPVRAGQRHPAVAGGLDQLAGSGQLFSRRRPRLPDWFLRRILG